MMRKIFFAILLFISLCVLCDTSFAVTADDYYNSAISKYLFGDIESAKNDLDHALSLDPAHQKSQALMRELKKESPKIEPPAPVIAAPRKPKVSPRISRVKARTYKPSVTAAPVATQESVVTQEAVIAPAAATNGIVVVTGKAKHLAKLMMKFIMGNMDVLFGIFGLLVLILLTVLFISKRYRTCPICGARYKSGSEFCVSCGTKVSELERLGERIKKWYGNYRWKKNPFTLDILPQLFTGYEDVASKVIEKVTARSGHIIITGGFGTGKTTLLRWLERRFSQNFFAIYVPRPPREINELIDLIVLRTGLKIEHEYKHIYSIGRHLKKLRKNVLLLIDEAHELTPEVEQPLRTLGDMDEVNLIIAGIPETREKFQREIKALFERIVLDITLEKLDLADFKKLIKKRIADAGGSDFGPFGDNVLEKIYEVSGGNPRRGIKACDAAVFKAIDNGKTVVDISMIA
jgi:type II secretory pathway predicted ATPase ExeA